MAQVGASPKVPRPAHKVLRTQRRDTTPLGGLFVGPIIIGPKNWLHIGPHICRALETYRKTGKRKMKKGLGAALGDAAAATALSLYLFQQVMDEPTDKGSNG